MNNPKELFGRYFCPVCGCELEFDGTAGADKCPGCNAPLVWAPLPDTPESEAANE